MALWRESADRAGRRLREATVLGQRPVLALSWVEGSEPAAGADAGVERTKPSTVLLLTFAAALRASWPNRSNDFPSISINEDVVLDAAGTARGRPYGDSVTTAQPIRVQSRGTDPGRAGAKPDSMIVKRSTYDCG